MVKVKAEETPEMPKTKTE